MSIPLKAVVEITELRHYLMLLSSFILFFSIITVFDTGLNRHDLLIGAVFFFSSSIVFWICSLAVKHGSEETIKGSDFALMCGIVLLIVWLALLICSFHFFIKSVTI